jgi:hypothetical protein
MMLILALAIGFNPAPAKAQCPMCKAAVTSNTDDGANGNALASGLNTGIIYLFVLPYLVLFSVGLAVVLHRRKQKRNNPDLSELRVEDVIGNHSTGDRREEEDGK